MPSSPLQTVEAIISRKHNDFPKVGTNENTCSSRSAATRCQPEKGFCSARRVRAGRSRSTSPAVQGVWIFPRRAVLHCLCKAPRLGLRRSSSWCAVNRLGFSKASGGYTVCNSFCTGPVCRCPTHFDRFNRSRDGRWPLCAIPHLPLCFRSTTIFRYLAQYRHVHGPGLGCLRVGGNAHSCR